MRYARVWVAGHFLSVRGHRQATTDLAWQLWFTHVGLAMTTHAEEVTGNPDPGVTHVSPTGALGRSLSGYGASVIWPGSMGGVGATPPLLPPPLPPPPPPLPGGGPTTRGAFFGGAGAAA